MKDQMNQPNQSQMMSMGQQLPQVMNQPQQIMNNMSSLNSQNSQMFVSQMMNPSLMAANQPHRGGGYGMWPPPQVDQVKFQTNLKGLGAPSASLKPMGPMGQRSNKNWKGKKGNEKWNNNIRKDLPVMGVGGGSSSSVSGNSGGSGAYNPPTLNELQQQNRLKARRYFPKKKFNHGGRSAPYAPRNTTSFLIRAKKSGGITSLVSPCPVTPAVLPTPIFSPSREVLVDMAKEEWGVDGYGSMKGLIRLRSPGNEADAAEDEEEDEGGSSESDVEEHVEVERRLDHDLSRFEMIYPNYSGADHSSYLLENRVDDQDTHIAQLEEENLILKERLFLMEREFDDLRMRLQCLERQSRGGERLNEEVVENDSENESESRGYGRSMEDNNEVMEENQENHEHSEDNNNNNNSNNDNNNGDNEIKQTESIEKGIETDVLMVENVDKIEETELKKEDDDGVAEQVKKNTEELSSVSLEKSEENAKDGASKDEENAANE
ncbi:hypothetical protein HanRHA438_Chr11g0520791 [Helianthus annuus]|nr:hypothetical protein HanHA300_Chr11g0416841 [Helianthus annuus]KAJ0686771.1 hypothetical protein HanLR1_Chr11g0418481 [Helianthus annuus]KAJ0690574.1 hypothetical protein HanOQP8_Chr11g0419361 [Helianthus annuus]KAJ0872175.1 hypothetical protein HanRHA438_Chr11g0520791 [Helianthus annuus]KAJ0876544.1 hypothetical protein HanPSC8_Chr11g0489681 [Helianthus annuus]